MICFVSEFFVCQRIQTKLLQSLLDSSVPMVLDFVVSSTRKMRCDFRPPAIVLGRKPCQIWSENLKEK